MLTEWLSRLRLLIKGKPGLDVDEELRFHLDLQRPANIAAGMSSGEARSPGGDHRRSLPGRRWLLNLWPNWTLSTFLVNMK
jgi:hypothetical protein